jgi:hypothetical protein
MAARRPGTDAEWLAKPDTLSTRNGFMVNKWLFIEQNCLLCDEPSAGDPLCSACEADLPWLDRKSVV